MSSAITCINLEEMTELLHLIYIYIYKENKFNKSCEHILYTRILEVFIVNVSRVTIKTFRFEEIDGTRTRLPNFFVQKKKEKGASMINFRSIARLHLRRSKLTGRQRCRGSAHRSFLIVVDDVGQRINAAHQKHPGLLHSNL